MLTLPIILGSEWRASAALAPSLTFAAGCLLAASPFTTNLRRVGRQHLLGMIMLTSAAPLLVGVPATIISGSPMPAAIGYGAMCSVLLLLSSLSARNPDGKKHQAELTTWVVGSGIALGLINFGVGGLSYWGSHQQFLAWVTLAAGLCFQGALALILVRDYRRLKAS